MATLNLYISREELAARLGLKRQTLDAWACRGRGPRFTTRRHRVRYSVLDVEAWLDDPAAYRAATPSNRNDRSL
jgi:hypothetical protein